MIHYKLYISYALSGVITKEISCQSKDDLYKFVGKLYLNSLEKIERIDFSENREQEDAERSNVFQRNG